jgi:serine/threonine-protein kinase
MQYVDGITLRAEMDRMAAAGERMESERIQRILTQTLEILDHAHSRGVVHRDLKPDNIMLVYAGTDAEEVRVLDFGLAKIARESNSFCGTPEYISPEMLLGLFL